MTKNKKSFVFVLIAVMTFVALTFSACGHTHTYEDRVVAPTCTEDGYTEHVCSCGYIYWDSLVAALGHNYVNGVCTRCGNLNESKKDMLLVHNLNTALAVDGEKHETMHDALNAALKSGYDVDKINASASGNEILWDSVNDKFCYHREGETKPEYIPNTELKREATGAEFWQICDKMPTNPEYSIYAGENWAEPEVTTSVGFDVGNNTNITSIIYNGTTEARNIIIRTNGGNLTVNGFVDPADSTKGDVITHYGEAGIIEVITCAKR